MDFKKKTLLWGLIAAVVGSLGLFTALSGNDKIADASMTSLPKTCTGIVFGTTTSTSTSYVISTNTSTKTYYTVTTGNPSFGISSVSASKAYRRSGSTEYSLYVSSAGYATFTFNSSYVITQAKLTTKLYSTSYSGGGAFTMSNGISKSFTVTNNTTPTLSDTTDSSSGLITLTGLGGTNENTSSTYFKIAANTSNRFYISKIVLTIVPTSSSVLSLSSDAISVPEDSVDSSTTVTATSFSGTVSYGVSSADSSIATGSVSDGKLFVNGLKVGTTTLMVSASDSTITRTQTVDVTVTAGASIALSKNQATLYSVGETTTAAITTANFSSTPTISLANSDTGVVNALVNSGALTVTAAAAGSSILTVTATDGTRSKSASLRVTVSLDPTLTLSQSALALSVSGSDGLIVATAKNFGAALTISAISGTTSVATVSVSSTRITVHPVANGTSNVVVTATDGTTTKTASVTVTVSTVTSYHLISDASELVVGGSYLISASNTAGTGTFMLNAASSSYTNYQGSTTNAIAADLTVTPSTTTEEFTLGGTSGAWTFTTTKRSSNGYLYDTNGDLYLGVSSSATSNYQWGITFIDGAAKITCPSNNYCIDYYSGYSIFVTEAGGQVYLYKKGPALNGIDPLVSLNPTTLTLTAGGANSSIAVTAANFSGTPTLGVGFSASGIVSSALVDNILTITPLAQGSTTLTLTATYGTESASATCSIVVGAATTTNLLISTKDGSTYGGTALSYTASGTNYSASTTAATVHDLDTQGGNTPFPSSGTHKLLVIPVVVTDFAANATNANRENIYRNFFGDSSDTSWESLASYYWKSSYQQLCIQGTVTPWWNCGKSSTELAAMTASSSTSANATTSNVSSYGDYYEFTWDLLEQALSWYKTTYNDNCTSYDYDSDGFVDGIWLVYSAPDYGNDSSIDSSFWAYTYSDYWNADSASTTSPAAWKYCWASYDFMYEGYGHGGVDAHTYIHESGHLMGLSDYYVAKANSGQINVSPMGSVDMMDYNVIDHNAYSKFLFGWVKPYVVSGSTTITLSSSATTGQCVLLPTSGGWNGYAFDEYMLLEFYTPEGNNYLDSQVGGYPANATRGFSECGVRIYHVDARMYKGTYSSSSGWSYAYTDTLGTATNTTGYGMVHSNSSAYNISVTGTYEKYYREVQEMDCTNKHNFDTDYASSYTSNGTTYYTGYVADNSTLFQSGDSFSFASYNGSFPQYDQGSKSYMNDGGTLQYSVSFSAMTTNSITLTITKS